MQFIFVWSHPYSWYSIPIFCMGFKSFLTETKYIRPCFMCIFSKIQIYTNFIVRMNCDSIKNDFIFLNWPAGWWLEISWFTLNGICIGYCPWCSLVCPVARFFPFRIAILTIFAFAFDTSLITTLLVPFILKNNLNTAALSCLVLI